MAKCKGRVFDFVNHDGCSETLVLSDEAKELSEIIADCVYVPGDQVLISYGKFSNATLLLDFGFILSHNIYDEVKIQLDIPDGDPLRNEKLDLLNTHHTPATEEDNNSFCSSLNVFTINLELKLVESGIVVRNKARLVAQGYNQQEGIDFDETFAHVARLEAIRMLLAFASFKGFKLFQMDVKSAFLNGFIDEEVYVKQPPGFENHEFPDHVYKLSKALYGLKQAPRAWYDRLTTFLKQNGFSRGALDTTLFIKKNGKDFLLVQIYVDDIIFGATDDLLCKEFSKCMQGEFEMSMMGELNYFLGLQIKQTKEGIYVNQAKYTRDLLKRFKMSDAKPAPTPMSPSTKLDKDEDGKRFDQTQYRGMIGSLLYLTASRPDIMFSVCLCARFQSNPKESHHIAVKRIFRYLVGIPNLGLYYPSNTSFDLLGYSDADFAGCRLDRKSTSGTCHFLGHSLVSWSSRKQNSVALSTTEAEYVSAGSCCAQILWMIQQLHDFDLHYTHVPILCDNTSAINLSRNPVNHSHAKHINLRHHFLRDHVQKGDILLEYVKTDKQLADIFTKPLCEEQFCFIRRELGMIDIR